MKNMQLWSKTKSIFRQEGRDEGEDVNSLVTKLNLNREYEEAFRTKSYLEIYKNVKVQLETKSLDEQPSSTSSSSDLRRVHLSGLQLEPRKETLIHIMKTPNVHQLLVNYFEISLEASRICELLLKNVHQVRVNYCIIKDAVKTMKRGPNGSIWSNELQAVYRNFALFSKLDTHLSEISPDDFQDLHEKHVLLFHKLTSKIRKTRRTMKLIRCIKKTVACSLVLICGALSVTVIVVAIHSMVGLVSAPGIMACSLGLLKKKLKASRQNFETTWLEKLGTHLDIAARGVYILINDFDTISRLAQRLHDEIEHMKFMTDMCIRKGKNEMLKEVIWEFEIRESCFLEQLEELEKHIYLCFVDINRTRRRVVQELMKGLIEIKCKRNIAI